MTIEAVPSEAVDRASLEQGMAWQWQTTSPESMPVAAVPAPPRTTGIWRRFFRYALPMLLAFPLLLLSGWAMVVWKFNGLYGQDPFAYYDYGVGSLQHFLLAGAPLPAMFWPLGYPFLITLASLLLGPVPLAGQVVSLLAGAAAISLTYLLGRDLLLQAGTKPALARHAAVIAALLLGVSGRVVESSVISMADTTALATALLSAWALVRWCDGHRRGETRAVWLTLAAVALAWSIVTRWGQAWLIPVWFAAALPAIRAQPVRFLRAAPPALFAAGAVLGAQLWLMLTVRPGRYLGPVPFAGDLGLVQGNGWSFAHLFQRAFLNADGAQRYAWPNLLFYLSEPFRLVYLTPVFFPAVLLGAFLVLRLYRQAVPLLLLWLGTLLLFDAGLAEQNPRFVLAVMPPLTILAGLGVAAVWDRLRPRLRPAGALLLVVGLLAVAAAGLPGMRAVAAERASDLQIASWAGARVPAGAHTIAFEITLTLAHATRLQPEDLSELTSGQLLQLAHGRKPLYLLVQVSRMEGQWATRPPGANYRLLRGRVGLIALGRLHGYTLFRVRVR